MIRLYRFMCAKYARRSIEDRELKVSRINELNDPFEFFAADLSDPQHECGLKEWKRQVNEVRGLICFSKYWHNLLLWSHYAKSHSGIALGFDVAEDLVFNVEYKSERFNLSEYLKDKRSFDETLIQNMICTKSTDWKYEKESRFFSTLGQCVRKNNLYFEDFSENPSLVLREVLIGMNCSEEPDEIAKLLANYPVRVAITKITPSPSEFALIKS